jgi:hypothetical protein
MSENVFARYLKEHLLETKQTSTHVGDPPKKPTTGDKIKPLISQSVGLESKQLGVTWFGHLLVLSNDKRIG